MIQRTTLNAHVADHFAQKISFYEKKIVTKEYYHYTRIPSQRNVRFILDVCEMEWQCILEEQDVKVCFSVFEQTLD